MTTELFDKKCMELLENLEVSRLCEIYHANFHIKELYESREMIIFFDWDGIHMTKEYLIDLKPCIRENDREIKIEFPNHWIKIIKEEIILRLERR